MDWYSSKCKIEILCTYLLILKNYEIFLSLKRI